MAGAGKHVLARDVKLHRHAGRFRRHGGEEDVRPDRAFAAKRAADKRADDAHVLRVEIRNVRARMLCTPLTNWVASQTVSLSFAFPGRDRAGGLDRIVRLGRRDVGLVERDQIFWFASAGSTSPFFSCTAFVLLFFRLLRVRSRPAHSQHRLFRRVADPDERGRVARLLERSGQRRGRHTARRNGFRYRPAACALRCECRWLRASSSEPPMSFNFGAFSCVRTARTPGAAARGLGVDRGDRPLAMLLSTGQRAGAVRDVKFDRILGLAR